MSTAVVKGYYQNPAVAGDYDRQRFAGWAGRWFDRLERRAVRRMVLGLRHRHARLSVLDVPCGTGRITELLLELDLPVVAGDISREMMDVARRRLALELRARRRRVRQCAGQGPADHRPPWAGPRAPSRRPRRIDRTPKLVKHL